MQVAFPDGWGPWVSRTGKSNGLLMSFIPGCLGALQTTLNKDEVCWKTASQVGKRSEHTGVDHGLLLTRSLCSPLIQPRLFWLQNLRTTPVNSNKEGFFYKGKEWLAGIQRQAVRPQRLHWELENRQNGDSYLLYLLGDSQPSYFLCTILSSSWQFPAGLWHLHPLLLS